MSSQLLLSSLCFAIAPGDDLHRPLSDAPKFASDAKAFASAFFGKDPLLPGFGLAVVVDDRVVLADGFGAADREKSIAADGDTLYYIASATKPFTALMATILDHRGEVELGSALADYLDAGQMDPKLEPEQILLRDLLCHTSGLDNDPITFRLAYSGEHDPETLWRLVGRTTANDVGRGRFRYTNYGYNLFTLVLERELHKKWQDLLQDEVFTPLGLTHTSAYASVPRAKGFKVAPPYRQGVRGLERLELDKRDAQMQSAGGMLTSPRDAARWLSFQINAGMLDGKQIVDAEIVRETQKPWTEIAPKDRRDEDASAVGGGWMITKYAAQRMLQHGGGYPGFRSLFAFLPDARIGVAVLINADVSGDVGSLLQTWALDWWLGRDVTGYPARVAKTSEQRDVGRASYAKSREEIAARPWQLTHDRSAYAGTFRNDELGTLVIEADATAIRVRLGLLACIAEPYTAPESIRVELIPGSGRVVQFEFDAEGRAKTVVYDGKRFERRGG
jgi:CubicO group peptidase (beta-lactamase class C family)